MFLTSFKASDRKRDRFMLIDCGLFRGSDSERATLQAVVKDIAKTTKGRLDVVVATHEHQDHLSGFAYAADVFREKIKIDKLWLAWTENPDDLMAQQLKGKIAQFGLQLSQTISRLQANPQRGFGLEAMGAVESVLDFMGLEPAMPADSTENTTQQSAPPKSVSINQQALQFLKSAVASPTDVICHEPATVATIDGLPNVRVFILGPPRSKRITQSDPSVRNPEVYNFAGSDRSDYAMRVPLWSDDEDEKDRFDSMPFESMYHLSVADATSKTATFSEQASQQEFFQRNYLNQTDEHGNDQTYRRIDDDWLYSLGNLALQLDGDTNNTSLALAIELIDSKKILLFPGDAQVGNWLSWHECAWKEEGITAENLLERTVFYKVGHHGSHNATLREKGLELMTSPDLVAMIPLDQDFAQNTKKWAMPFGSLYNALAIKTKGRILQADGKLSTTAIGAAKLLSEDEEQAYTTAVKHSKDRRPTTKGIDRPLWTEFVVR